MTRYVLRYPQQLVGLVNRRYKRYDDPCAKCGTMWDRTRHHLKNKEGKKTGRIVILCRKCHDEAEAEYRRLGIAKFH